VATVNDINTKSAVRKFLERRSVVNREDATADSADEVTAVLESVALSFLLYPQAALSFVLQAKNVLQQIISTDRDILDYLLKAIDDVDSPDEAITDTSDLIEAQAALVEVDRIGRVSNDVLAYDRYTKAIDRFLDRRLARSLKRRHRGEFERTGTEARQDIFRVLSAFGPTHDLMISRLGQLLSGVDNFRSVSLTRIVSTRTVSRVRSSLGQVIRGIQKQQLSKTAAAVELLSGAAALSSVSNSRDIYDPTIDTESYPVGRVISIRSEQVPATARGTELDVELGSISTPWIFDFTVDGTNYPITLPVSGASGRHYVKAASGSAIFNIPVDKNVLYVQFDGITPPPNEAAMVRAVSVPTGGSVPISAVLTALNDGSTGLIDGTAVQLATTGRIVLYGSASVTGITVHTLGRGSFDGSGNYIPATGSVHQILGFSDEQTSGDPELFSPAELIDLLPPYVPLAEFEISDSGESVISTSSTELLSSLSFSGSVAAAFGFSGDVVPDPSYLELIENGEAVDPATLGIFIGSIVVASDIQSLSSRNLLAPIETIDGTHLVFADDISLPRTDNGHVRVLSPLVYSVQSLFDSVRSFKNNFVQDSRNLQRVLSPLLSRPTLAQINDAKRILQEVRDKVDDLFDQLSSTVVRTDRSEFDFVTKQISASLEERGLDRALELLQSCQFAEFFSLTSEGASKGNRFLKATEQVGRNEFAQRPSEQDQDDTEPMGTTPDENLLPGEELLENEEQL
jgi:hypothetical protein